MKKMYVCGDSWLSPSVETPGLHMAEIVAERLHFELVPLSQGGMSNGGICIQIDTAIDHLADFILINTTETDRMELPIGQHVGSKFTTADIKYIKGQYQSSLVPFNGSSPTLISNSLNSLLSGKGLDDHPEKIKAIEEYFRHLFSPEWHRQIDQWCMYSVLHKLHLSGIPYLLVLDTLDIPSFCPFIENVTLDYNSFTLNMLKAASIPGFCDPGYHTLPEAQQQAADHILKYIEANPRIFSSLLPDHSTSPPCYF